MKELNLIYVSTAIFLLFLPVCFPSSTIIPLILCRIILATKHTFAEFLPLEYGELGTALGQTHRESSTVMAASKAGSGKKAASVRDSAASFSSCFWFWWDSVSLCSPVWAWAHCNPGWPWILHTSFLFLSRITNGHLKIDIVAYWPKCHCWHQSSLEEWAHTLGIKSLGNSWIALRTSACVAKGHENLLALSFFF